MAAASRPHRREVSTSSAAFITHWGGFLASADPGKMANLVPRAPRYSRVSPCLRPMWLSSPASRAVWDAVGVGPASARFSLMPEVAGDRELAVEVLPLRTCR